MQQPAPTLFLPRGLILISSVWLVASWVVAIGFRTPIEASSASYTPGVRVMLICTAVGLVVGWPLLRLSQGGAAYPIKQTALDLVVLVSLVQVVVWPLRLVTPWSPWRTAAIDATLIVWVALAGAFVASAAGSVRSGPRNLAMLGCAGIALLGPAAAWMSVSVWPMDGFAARLAQLGPVFEVHALSVPTREPPEPETWRWIALLAVATAVAWSGIATAMLAREARISNARNDKPLRG